MARKPIPREDLRFQQQNTPKPVEFEYADPITESELRVIREAMSDEVRESGVVISGEPW